MVFMVQTYVVKPEKQAELEALMPKVLKLIKDKPEKFKGLKSYKAFTHKIGSVGTYHELFEFADMGVAEKFLDYSYQDKEILKFWEEFMGQIVPETFTVHFWAQLHDYTAK